MTTFSTLRSAAAIGTLLFTLGVRGQSDMVDIRLDKQGPDTLVVSLLKHGPTFSQLVSSISFTLKWPASSGATLLGAGLPCPEAIPVSPSPMVTANDWNYRSYFVFAFEQLQDVCPDQILATDTWVPIVRLRVNGASTCAAFEISTDEWTLANNRGYYISLNGENRTGMVVPSVLQVGDDCTPQCTVEAGPNVSLDCGAMGLLNATTPIANAALAWSGPNSFTSNSATTTAPEVGWYYVTASGDSGCVATDSTYVGEGVPVFSVTTSCDSGGSGSVTATNASFPLTCYWHGGGTTAVGPSVNGLGFGYYEVFVSDAGGCFFTTDGNIGPCSGVLAIYPAFDLPHCGASDGVIDITMIGGTAPYLYSWSNGAITQDLQGIPPGVYTVTVSDAEGDTISEVFDLSINGCLSAVSIVTPAGCAGVDGSIDLTVSGGTPPYAFTWNTGATSEDLDGLQPGYYTYSVTDSLGHTTGSFMTVALACDSCVPVLVHCPADTTVNCGTPTLPSHTGMAVFEATDGCAAPQVNYQNSGIGGWCPWHFVRTFNAQIGGGQVVSCYQVITVQDTTPPQFFGVPPETYTTCDQIAVEDPLPVVTATNQCKGTAVSVSFSADTIPGFNDCTYTIVRTWTGSDFCGNGGSKQQIIHVSCGACGIQGNMTPSVHVQVSPDPFPDRTSLRFMATENTFAELQVFNAHGQLVSTLFEGQIEAELSYNVTFEPNTGAAGVYSYRLITATGVVGGRMFYQP